jgi:preprotein translocase subunit SecA
MIGNFIKKIFGSKNERELKRIGPIVEAINSHEPFFKSLTDDQLREKTNEFKERT